MEPRQSPLEPPWAADQPPVYPDREELLDAVRALYRQIERLEHIVARQEQQMKSMTVEMLLRGQWKPKDQVNFLLGFSDTCYLVGNYDFLDTQAVSTAENPQMAALKQRVFDLFHKSFQQDFPCYYCESEFGLNTVLLNTRELDRAGEERLLCCAQRFLERSRQELGLELELSLSACCPSVDELPEALEQTRRLWRLQHGIPNCRTILYAGRLELDPEPTVLTKGELLARAQGYILERDVPGLHRCVSQLAVLETRDQHSPAQAAGELRRYLEQLQKQLGLQKYGMETLMAAQAGLESVRTIDELLIVLNEYFSQMDGLLAALEEQSRKERQTRTLADQTKVYIDDHLTNPGLNLNAIARALAADENRISKTFKAKFGVGVLHYTQNQRVRLAMSLLPRTDQDIPGVAEQVGFSSRRSFDRVFRQFTGMTPAQYRSEHRTR